MLLDEVVAILLLLALLVLLLLAAFPVAVPLPIATTTFGLPRSRRSGFVSLRSRHAIVLCK